MSNLRPKTGDLSVRHSGRLHLAACGLAALFVLAVGEAFAAPLTAAQFRPFRGRYTGEVSGIAGNPTGSTAVGPFTASVVVRSKRREQLSPLIDNLYHERSHQIVWRKPNGTPRRAVLVGIYRGTFHDSSGAQYQVQGTRRLVLTRRTAKGARRQVARLSDNLKEVLLVSGNPLAAQDLAGRLRK